jgi:hypothetical protein
MQQQRRIFMFFFIDESGIDKTAAPYEVLAAAAIRESSLWEFIKAEHDLEEQLFGNRLSNYGAELKGSKLLSKKRFHFAHQKVEINADDQQKLAASCLQKGELSAKTKAPANVTAKELTALGKASLEFVDRLLDLSAAFDIKVFASMVEINAPTPPGQDKLRKDYVYLFERMFYYLEDLNKDQQGIIVFDELEKAMARLLVDQVSNYFIKSAKGRERSRLIVPEPFFVHSDLTTLIQLADILAYIINWGFRASPKMKEPTRPEIVPYAMKVAGMQYKGLRSDQTGGKHIVFGITCLDDLRGADERS